MGSIQKNDTFQLHFIRDVQSYREVQIDRKTCPPYAVYRNATCIYRNAIYISYVLHTRVLIGLCCLLML